ncbi:hypothetical protein [Limnoglobus roseus]|uniref:Carboxypeptidase regulatory-like domain-containing protein n=1 Tax=Limnoglobus roseus TaxID=2598579 RepID=A0A5C1A8R3_9BACT|nr:hypothetical protein [Limnoglobus roseus]QEL13544.1 carboxypeptidase regulatory-like domain-containing protein [Limnoglobus roseus]
MKFFPRTGLTTLLAAVAALTAGCGKTETRVTGKVSFQNAPLTRGTVILVDATGVYHQGAIDAGGNFTIESVALGPAKIGVTVPKVPKPAEAKTPAGGKSREKKPVVLEGVSPQKAPDPPAAHPPEAAGPQLPAAVNDPTTSGITRDIKPGEPLDIAIP